ncbi:MAG: hypothetical protein ACRDJ9_26205 [Dehalococcoidia bacterium]
MSPSEAPHRSPADADAAAPASGSAEFGEAVARWEQAAEWPLTALALLFLAGYAVPILFS